MKKAKTGNRTRKSIRRSFVVPADLLAEAQKLAGRESAPNPNRVVCLALSEFVRSRKRVAFERAMERMGRDPALRRASDDVNRAFGETESDGLTDD